MSPRPPAVLDVPRLTVTPYGGDLLVDLHPPVEHLRKFYETFEYKLRIQSNGFQRSQVLCVTLDQLVSHQSLVKKQKLRLPVV